MENGRTVPITLSVQEVAVILNVDERTVRRGIDRGQVPGKKIGRIWRIPRSYVLEFLQAEEGNCEPAQAIERTTTDFNRHTRNG